MTNSPDPYEQILFTGYTEDEILEIELLMSDWDQATYPTIAHSIVDHAERHGFSGEYLRYLRKAKNFNKRGARQKVLSDGALTSSPP
ncbi:hypothetical protein ACQ4M3_28560 [Leptolyngbya sp. AN03gr2]|uniref:hypothetical protein n=1 Tax=unclassified Leptolyngbya TaxID=2650499 RepID=UPI003D31916C